MIKYSCVIPTLGRSTLRRAALSVWNQNKHVELVIVVDQRAEYEFIEKQLAGIEAKVIREAYEGVSNLRNLGVERASGEWILFLDDDDMWLPTRISNLESQIAANPEIRFFSSRSLQISGNRFLIRPTVSWNSHQNLMKKWYRPSIGKSKMYMATGTWAVRHDLAQCLKFDAHLEIREDLKYLFSVSEQVIQSKSVDCVVYASQFRAVKRDTFKTAASWARFIWQHSPLIALNFIFFEFLRSQFILQIFKVKTWSLRAR
jgi:glycosyltransferase involved in cell wall biosynthesis